MMKLSQIAISRINDQQQFQARFNMSYFLDIVDFMEEIKFFEMDQSYDNATEFLYPHFTITVTSGILRTSDKIVSFYGNTGPESLHQLQTKIDKVLGGLDWRGIPSPNDIWQISFVEQVNTICEETENCPPYAVFLDRNGDARMDFLTHDHTTREPTKHLYGNIDLKTWQDLTTSLVKKTFFLMNEFYGDSSEGNYVSVGASWGAREDSTETFTVSEWNDAGPRALHRMEKDIRFVVKSIKWQQDIFQRYFYVAIITGGIVLTISVVVVIIVSLLASRYQFRSKTKEERPMLVFKSDYV